MCNNSHSTLQRLLKNDPELRQSFKDKFAQDEESRANFIKRSRGLMGSDLKALLQTMVRETTAEIKIVKRSRHVDFLDEQDLKKRFVDRPEALANVMASGNSFIHPETGATMYQLTSFTAEHPYRCNIAIPRCIIGPHTHTMRGLTRCAVLHRQCDV